jgi:tRNA pseudouridine65 synthase
MNILYEDQYFFAIDKPSGFFVHPPETSRYPVPPEKICTNELSRRFKAKVYPAHRLDAPTSGVVLFAKSQGYVKELNRLFQVREMQKTYHAVARGIIEEQGSIALPLEIAGFENKIDAHTQYRRLATTEFQVAVGKKYPTARYSLVEVEPVTGRWHQIRRHFDRIAHPLLGDIEHGDSHHNRFFRDDLKISGLCLRAVKIEFTHPWSQTTITIAAPEDDKWQRIYQLFQNGNWRV